MILVMIVLLPWPYHFLPVALGSMLNPLKNSRIVLEQVEDAFDLRILLWMEEEEMHDWTQPDFDLNTHLLPHWV